MPVALEKHFGRLDAPLIKGRIVTNSTPQVLTVMHLLSLCLTLLNPAGRNSEEAA